MEVEKVHNILPACMEGGEKEIFNASLDDTLD